MRRHLLVTTLLALTVVGVAWGTGTLSVPNVFTNVTGNQPAANLDANFTAIQTYVNNRELVVGLLANRSAAGYNGRSYFATDVNGGTLYLDDGSTWRSVSPVPAVRSYLAGCTLSNDSGTPNAVLDVAAGFVTSDDQTTPMTLAAITGSVSGTWVVGTGQNKLDAGTVANTTWYHVFVIERTDTAVVDILFSTSAASPTMPTNYTKKRRIGSFRTDGSAHILAFTQDGDYFLWAATVADISANNPGTAAVSRTLTVPLGVNVAAMVLGWTTTGINTFTWLTDLATTDVAAAQGASNFISTSALTGQAVLTVRTNTAAQIRSRLSASDATVTLNITTLGWLDRRGRDG